MKIDFNFLKNKLYDGDKSFLNDGEEFMNYLCRANPDEDNELDFLFWTYLYFDYDNMELEKLKEVLDIDTSSSVFQSYQVIESKNVLYSNDIIKSEEIYYSKNVKNSKFVRSSEEVFESENVLKSNDVHYSKNVLESKKIEKCEDVYKSFACNRSKKVSNSIKVDDSIGIETCSDVIKCFFSKNLKNCEYCLFCEGIENKKFFVFNEKVSEKDFFVILSLVQNLIEKDLDNNVRVFFPKKASFSATAGAGNVRIYSKLTNETINQLFGVPNFNRKIIFDITLNNKFIII